MLGDWMLSPDEPVMLKRSLAERVKLLVNSRKNPMGIESQRSLIGLVHMVQIMSNWSVDSTYVALPYVATATIHSTDLYESYASADEITVDLYSESKISGQNSFVLAVYIGVWVAVAPVNAIQCGATTSELTAGGTCSVTVGSGENAYTLTDVRCFLLNSDDTIPNGSKVVCVWRMSPVENVFCWEIISMRCAQ